MKESMPTEQIKKRAAIYARFSTDLQNERSIEDQVSLYQSYAQREDLSVVGTYEEARNRPIG
jgi:site-specific DNA recombinase